MSAGLPLASTRRATDPDFVARLIDLAMSSRAEDMYSAEGASLYRTLTAGENSDLYRLSKLVGRERNILELGCGDGRATAALLPGCRSLYAMDNAKTMIDALTRRVDVLPTGLRERVVPLLWDMQVPYPDLPDVDTVIVPSTNFSLFTSSELRAIVHNIWAVLEDVEQASLIVDLVVPQRECRPYAQLESVRLDDGSCIELANVIDWHSRTRVSLLVPGAVESALVHADRPVYASHLRLHEVADLTAAVESFTELRAERTLSADLGPWGRSYTVRYARGEG